MGLQDALSAWYEVSDLLSLVIAMIILRTFSILLYITYIRLAAAQFEPDLLRHRRSRFYSILTSLRHRNVIV